MPLTATGMRTVMRQIQDVESAPIDGIRVCPSEDLNELRFDLDGPIDTPFAAGRFHVALVFDEHYPDVPPKGFFRTKIFHPNIAERGDICVNALKKDWQPNLGLRHVLVVIRCLLVEPNPESALNEEAARLLLEDYVTYERKAVMYTKVHALRPPGASRFTAGEEVESKMNKPGAARARAHGSNENHPPGSGDVADGLDGHFYSSQQQGGSALQPVEGNAFNTATVRKEEGGSGASALNASDKAKKRAAEKKKAALKRI